MHASVLCVYLLCACGYISIAFSQLIAGGPGYAATAYTREHYMVIPNTNLFTSRDFTIEFWAYDTALSRVPSIVAYAVNRGPGSKLPGSLDDQRLTLLAGDSSILFYLDVVVEAETPQLTSGWHHYAISFADSDKVAAFYLDGVELFASTLSGLDTVSALENGGAFVIGNEQDDLGSGFDASRAWVGQIDELRVWSRRRTVAEIRALMNVGITTAQSGSLVGLTGLYNFEQYNASEKEIPNAIGTGSSMFLAHWDIENNVYTVGGGAQKSGVRGVSSAPIVNQDAPTVVTAVANVDRVITLRANDASNGQLAYTIAQFPTYGSLYKTDGVTQISTTSAVIGSNQLIYRNAGSGPVNDTFMYQVSNGAQQATGSVLVLQNTAPVAVDAVIPSEEDLPVVVQLDCEDPDGDLLTATIASLPTSGALFQLADDKVSQGSVISLGDTVTHASRAVVYSPPLNEPADANFTFTCSDGVVQSNAGNVQISVVAFNDKAFVGGGLFAVDMDGIGAYLNFPSSSVPITAFDFWLNPRAPYDKSVITILSWADIDINLGYNQATQSYSMWAVSTISKRSATPPVGSIPTGNWTHVAMDIKNNTLRFFVNQLEVGTAPSLFSSIDPSSFNLGRGKFGEGFYNGEVEELRLWNTPYTQAALLWSSRHAVIGDEFGLLTAWGLNEGTGTVAKSVGRILQAGSFRGSPNKPRWTQSSLPGRDTVYIDEDSAGVMIRMPYVDVEGDLAAILILSLPEKGTLYQVNEDDTLGDAFGPTDFYQAWLSDQEPVSQWVSGVSEWSSQFGSGPSYHTLQILGEPSTFIETRSTQETGDCACAWSPAKQCAREWSNGTVSMDYLEFEYEQEVFVTGFEFYENYYPGAVSQIYLMHPDGTWRAAYNEPPQQLPNEYRVFRPYLECKLLFKTRKVRIVHDTCAVDGWNELDAIKMIGIPTLKAGVVSNSQGKVFYVPFENESGEDEIEFRITDCPYEVERESISGFLKFQITPSNDVPLTVSQKLNASENVNLEIRLNGTDLDGGDNTSAIILSMPSNARLWNVDAVTGSTSSEITTASPTVTHPDSVLIYEQTSGTCGFGFDKFTFYFCDKALTCSNVSEAAIDMYCTPGEHDLSSGLIYVLGAVTGVLIFIALVLICFTFYVGFIARISQFMIASPVFLLIVLMGAILSYSTVFVWMITVSAQSCLARVWVLNLGITIMFSGLFVKTWRVYRIFSNKKLKVSKVPDRHLWIIICIILAVQLVALAIYSFVDPPRVSGSVEPGNLVNTQLTCTTNYWTLAMLMALQIVLIIWGVFLAVGTWKVSTVYNESRYIAVSIYVFAGVGAIVVPIAVLVNDDPAQFFVLVSVGILLVVTSALCFLFIPKIVSMAKGENLKEKHQSYMSKKSSKADMEALLQEKNKQIADLQAKLEAISPSKKKKHKTSHELKNVMATADTQQTELSSIEDV